MYAERPNTLVFAIPDETVSFRLTRLVLWSTVSRNISLCCRLVRQIAQRRVCMSNSSCDGACARTWQRLTRASLVYKRRHQITYWWLACNSSRLCAKVLRLLLRLALGFQRFVQCSEGTTSLAFRLDVYFPIAQLCCQADILSSTTDGQG